MLDITSQICNKIFSKSLQAYRCAMLDRPAEAIEGLSELERILYQKQQIDNEQWDLEDEIRNPKISSERGMELKRKIDKLNQERTDLVESLDDMIFDSMQGVDYQPNARISTETPAWAIDRLSILHIKIYRMSGEAVREDASAAHRAECRQKLVILERQLKDLSSAIDCLLEDMRNGRCQAKTYKQMKMYNDPELNPMLRDG